MRKIKLSENWWRHSPPPPLCDKCLHLSLMADDGIGCMLFVEWISITPFTYIQMLFFAHRSNNWIVVFQTKWNIACSPILPTFQSHIDLIFFILMYSSVRHIQIGSFSILMLYASTISNQRFELISRVRKIVKTWPTTTICKFIDNEGNEIN